jgi:ABC-type transport system substrate-binding protein
METPYTARRTAPRLSRRELLKAGLAAGVTLSAWPVYGPTLLWGEEVGPPKRGGILRVRGRDPVHFDPHLTRNARTHTALSFVYSKLLRHKVGADVRPGTFIIEPDLAERWESPDDTTYIFHLHQGIKWHHKPPVNGRELVAEDVKFTFDRFLAEKGNPGRYMLDSVDHVAVVDRYTVKFILHEPFVWLLDILANALCTWIVAPEVVEKYGDLKKEETAIGQMRVLKGRETQRVTAAFNLKTPIFRDVRVRQALGGYGIDRQAIVKTALLGLGQPVWSFVPHGAKDHLDFGEHYPYDPEKARALLKEAGYDEKNPLRFSIMAHAAEAALPTVATIMKTQYAKLGVEVTVEVIDRPIYLRRLTRDRDWEQSLIFTGAALDAYSISRALDTRAGNNTLNHQDTHIDALTDRMKEAATEEAFREAGHDLQRYMAENMMIASIASVPFLQAARPHVQGYEHLHGFKIQFETTWLSK